MKKTACKLLLLGVALIVAFLSTGCTNEGLTYQVNDVASDPGGFTGRLNVVGIVNAYSPTDPSVIGIMDKKELQCNTPNCNKVLLPVSYNGTRPAIGAEVKASGSIVAGKILQAETLEVLVSHNLGDRG